MSEQEDEAIRLAKRENAKRVFRESGVAEMLQRMNRDLLKGRGRFEEYDSMVLFKWGTSSTLRHMWIEVVDDTLRFRFHEHRQCSRPAPICDGEYHTFTSVMWKDRAFMLAELKKYYDRPVAEASSD